MNLIVDASVAVKWFVDEEGSTSANEVLLGEEVLIAPDLIFLEVANALSKRVRRGHVAARQVSAGLATLRDIVDDPVPTGYLIEEAASLSVSFQHPIYDCVYLVLARRMPEPAVLLSADRRLVSVAQRIGVPSRSLL